MWRAIYFSAYLVFNISVGAYQLVEYAKNVEYQYDVEKWLNDVDADLQQFNSLAAHITWRLSTDPDDKTAEQGKELGKARNRWRNKVCDSPIRSDWITAEQKRKMYLLCRGPKFTDEMALEYLYTLGKLAQEYNSEVCLVDSPIYQNATGLPKPGTCLYGEPDLERLMKRTDLSGDQLRWLWLNWHDYVGPRIKDLFLLSVNQQNVAARNNGYHDIGEAWREELEIQDLEAVAFKLYQEVEPLYVLLHAVIRHKLYEKFGPAEINPRGPIPVHLLGNMWGQDWSPLIDMFNLTRRKIDLDAKLRKKHKSVKDMVVESEDFYTSMSLPKMTEQFWKHSLFEDGANVTVCHGTAANLYSKDDFRMLMCGKTGMDDFYVIHHEMGHIEYYMAYSDQPAIFQDGANTAIHESIGDAMMHGVMTPQHLQRLGLLTDEELLDPNTEMFLLLYQALSKIPEIPFSLVVDKYRWEIFRGAVPYSDLNKFYWALNRKFRGIVPPEHRTEDYFDAGAKFHIPDNTPYIRYFLSSIIQMQLFKSFCELSLYGKNSETSYEDEYLPLHRCDIYGSKNAGKKLLAMMEKGSSIKWDEALTMLTGSGEISTKPFLEYYKPIYNWLEQYIKSNNVYIGW